MKFIATLLLLAAFAANGNAQISIQTADFLFYQHIKTTVQPIIQGFKLNDHSMLGSLVGEGGTDKTWDLRGISYTPEPQSGLDTTLPYPSNAALANDPDYTSSTMVLLYLNSNQPRTYSFLQMTYDGIYNLGMTQDSAGIATKLAGWNPPLKEQAIPMKYGNTWQCNSNFSGASLKSGEIRSVAIEASVDAWGTLILPNGLPYPALRVKKQIITTDTKDGMTSHIDTTFEYNILTRLTSAANITTNSKNEITSAEYTMTPTASVSSDSRDEINFAISQNPVTSAGTMIIYSLKNDAPVQIEMMDVLGNNVRTIYNNTSTAGEHIIPLNPTTLPNGTYFIRITSHEINAMRKVVLAR